MFQQKDQAFGSCVKQDNQGGIVNGSEQPAIAVKS